ncbi:hypothetical protein [Bremerella sp.]|uniref:hypothetical protein n=1 Tax=Bremerella sp. TaxID=2795602 RepID=UPI003919BDC2
MDTTFSKSNSSVIAFTVWLAAVILVFGSLGIYGSKQGARSLPPKQWPSDSSLERSTEASTLLVFVHPECPCSRATLENLTTIASNPSLSVVIVCIDVDSNLATSSNDFASCRKQLDEWQQQTNVTLVQDTDGSETRRFQAATSGHCLLFDSQGTLKFSGGATSSRGHEGASAGLASLKSALNGHTEPETYPVFGCPLFLEPEDPPANNRQQVPESLLPSCCKGSCRA